MADSSPNQRLSAILLTGIIGVAVAGYLVGIDAGVPREDVGQGGATAFGIDDTEIGDADHHLADDHDSRNDHGEPGEHPSEGDHGEASHQVELVASSIEAIPAADYAEMRRTEFGSATKSEPSLTRIHAGNEFQRCVSCHNPHTIKPAPNEQHKLESLSIRASRRAYNGAPPVIPHAIERTNDAACYACHGEGALVGQRVANRMSHGPLPNCLQCHAPPPPQIFANLEKEPASTFVGLPAPTSGPRAFDGAPPVIPHSTWMRNECLSCHGGIVGWPGLEVTHRWRTNCMQCHATSSQLEQAVANDPGQPTPPWLAAQ